MNEITLALLKQDEKARVTALQGGAVFQHRLRSIGLKEGKLLHIVTRHHFSGPLVVEIERRHITIGCKIAQKIAVTRVP